MQVLIIGLGSIAKKHIAALKGIDPHVEIFALRNSSTAEQYENVHNIFRLEELADLNIEFAIISNPTSAHASAIERLIPFNIPLFIEKPLFDNLNNRFLIDQINRNNIFTYVACNLRFLDSLTFAKNFISEKRINEVNIYCGSYLPDWRPNKDFRKTYSANKEMGGGVHIDLIHELDYTYWIFDKPNEVLKTFTNTSSLAISSIDYANYLLRYDAFCVNIVLNYFRRDPKRDLEIVCDNGTLYVDLLKNEVYWNKAKVFESAKTIKDTYMDQLQFFIENINSPKTSFNTINEAYEILELCLAND